MGFEMLWINGKRLYYKWNQESKHFLNNRQDFIKHRHISFSYKKLYYNKSFDIKAYEINICFFVENWINKRGKNEKYN